MGNTISQNTEEITLVVQKVAKKYGLVPNDYIDNGNLKLDKLLSDLSIYANTDKVIMFLQSL